MYVKLATHVRMEQLANPTVTVRHASAQPTSKENSAIKVKICLLLINRKTIKVM